MRIHAAAVARGVPPDAAYRWWTDFRDGGDDHPFIGIGEGGRRLLRVTAHEVEMEDSGKLLGLRFVERTTARLDPAALVVHLRGRNNLARFEGAYAFEPHPAGTRVTFRGTVTPRGVLRAVSLLGKPLVWAFVRWDLRHHARDLERELGRGA